MSAYFIMAIANLVIGACIGVSGVAGFLLPVTYISWLGMDYYEAMALSFFAFFIAGVMGAYRYRKHFRLDKRIARPLAAGSVAGALLAVLLRSAIRDDTAGLLLYGMVLFSGVSTILPRKEHALPAESPEIPVIALLSLGVGVGLVCSLSGAGGPVLAVPLLLWMGVGVHEAVGISLYESAFIALPAFVGYALRIELAQIFPALAVAGAAHLGGIYWGSRSAERIPQRALRLAIAAISIGVSVWKLAGFF